MTVLDVLVALVIVAALIGGDACLHHAPAPGDRTPPDTARHVTGRVVVAVDGAGISTPLEGGSTV